MTRPKVRNVTAQNGSMTSVTPVLFKNVSIYIGNIVDPDSCNPSRNKTFRRQNGFRNEGRLMFFDNLLITLFLLCCFPAGACSFIFASILSSSSLATISQPLVFISISKACCFCPFFINHIGDFGQYVTKIKFTRVITNIITNAICTVKRAISKNTNAPPNVKNVAKKVPESFRKLGWLISLVYAGIEQAKYCVAKPMINCPMNRKAWCEPNTQDWYMNFNRK